MVSSYYSYGFIAIHNRLHTVTWFQTFLSYTTNFQRSISPIDGILTDTTTPGQSRPAGWSMTLKGYYYILL